LLHQVAIAGDDGPTAVAQPQQSHGTWGSQAAAHSPGGGGWGGGGGGGGGDGNEDEEKARKKRFLAYSLGTFPLYFTGEIPILGRF